MKNIIFVVILLCTILGFTACNTNSNQDDDTETNLIERDSAKYSEALYGGTWVYDMPFMEKECERVNEAIVAFAHRNFKNLNFTPEKQESMLAPMKEILSSDQFKNVEWRFFPDHQVEFSTPSRSYKAQFGFTDELQNLVIRDIVLPDGKEIPDTEVTFHRFRMSSSSFTQEEELFRTDPPYKDTTFTIRWRFVRE